MIGLKEMICESQNEPNINKKQVYDSLGEEWEMKCFCSIDGKKHKGCNSLKELLDKYDLDGALEEGLEELSVDFGFAVGCENEDGERAAFIWGEDGVDYNK